LESGVRHIDLEAEKKKNVRIAVGIAAAGVITGIVFYMAVFALFIISPFSFMNLVPMPGFDTDAAAIDNKIFLFSTEVDFSGASFARQPAQRKMMRVFDGSALSGPVEIEPYTSFALYRDTAYLFDSGLYRKFDGSTWTEIRNTSIGGSPRGAVGPEGIWVLASIKDRPVLKLIKKLEAVEIPLPEDFDPSYIKASTSSIVWFRGRLHLFVQYGDGLYHLAYTGGGKWAYTGYMGDTGEYRAAAMGERLMVFKRKELGPVRVSAFDGASWSAPEELGIEEGGMIVDFQPVMFQGKPALYTQGAFSRSLHPVAGGAERISLGSSFKMSFIYDMALFGIVPFVVTFIVIYILSLVVNTYKLTRWQAGGGDYEFASLFRRFLAHAVDVLITTLPIVLYSLNALGEGFPGPDPFRALALYFFLFMGWIVWTFLYFSLFEGIWGKTPGKKLLGIEVLREDFSRCTLGAGFLRTLLRVVDSWFYYLVGAVAMGATLKWQRLGDLAAGTVVVRYKRP
jgi:uncharacterized RDD family membrane protein YckC